MAKQARKRRTLAANKIHPVDNAVVDVVDVGDIVASLYCVCLRASERVSCGGVAWFCCVL